MAEPTSANTRKRSRSARPNKKSFAYDLLDAWSAKAEQERSEWLNRPRLHTAIFEQARRDEELEKLLAANGATFKDDTEAKIFAQRKKQRKEEIHAGTGSLGWSSVQLETFIDTVLAYRRDATIQNYLSIKRKFPEIEIQVAHLGGIDPLFSLEGDFRAQGINPDLIAGALDSNEPSVDALSLRLLERLAERDQLPKDGAGFIDQRRKAISDATVNYLIATMLEGYDWNDEVYRVPASLVVLIRHQLCGTQPDFDAEYRLRERKKNTAIGIARSLKPDERLSINKLKELSGLSRTTAARWLSDPYFQGWLDFGRKHLEEGLFDVTRQRTNKRPKKRSKR
ncbi:hypothetical protein [Bradyrhizobium diazoefficiens]